MEDQVSTYSNNIPQNGSAMQPNQNGLMGNTAQTMMNNSQTYANSQMLGNMDHTDDVLQNLTHSQYDDTGEYEGFDDFPLDALAFNQGLAAYASLETDNKGQKLKEARLMEALDRQTALLDTISQSYKKNKDLRQKAELRKLKNRLEKLENQKLFRELEIQQSQMANEVCEQNNQLIFSHMNAQAQLKANPIVISMGGGGGQDGMSGLNPLLLHAALNNLSKPNPNSLSSLRPPLPITHPLLMRGPYGSTPMMPGFNRPPPFYGQMPHGFRGPLQMGMPPFGHPMNKNLVKLPPIEKHGRKQSKYTEESPRSHSKKKRGDVDEYLNNVLAKQKIGSKSKIPTKHSL